MSEKFEGSVPPQDNQIMEQEPKKQMIDFSAISTDDDGVN